MSLESLKFKHPEIYNRVNELNDKRITDFSLTSEGYTIWSDVERGDYDSWYKFWSKNAPESVEVEVKDESYFNTQVTFRTFRTIFFLLCLYDIKFSFVLLALLEILELILVVKLKK
jgi:hypothetical protein